MTMARVLGSLGRARGASMTSLVLPVVSTCRATMCQLIRFLDYCTASGTCGLGVHVHLPGFVRTYTHTHARTLTDARACAHTHTHTQTRTHTHTHTLHYTILHYNTQVPQLLVNRQCQPHSVPAARQPLRAAAVFGRTWFADVVHPVRAATQSAPWE